MRFEQIMDNPALTDLAKANPCSYNVVTSHFISHYERDAEVARAMGDKETAVREQIKAGVLNSARGMYQHCYRCLTGSREDISRE